MRTESFAQNGPPSVVDRLGVWLSATQIRRFVPSFAGLRVGDFGCGYQATFSRGLVGVARELVLADVALAPDLGGLPTVRVVTGELPGALGAVPDASLDVVLLISVLEHLSEPAALLLEVRRLLAEGGRCLVNVPSWRGKWFLETSAFRLGASPPGEMDDHKMYYDPRDLWPLLVQAGFRPSRIRCFTHKLGLNTFAYCENGERRR